ncbi:alpha/beta hydrolase [Candidatus Aerophobetes bacterium]|uniref:Alpha/beta hydrolase n=1 Tax=Aerophobetes bacterium TaxID=2030807 RepID=A0A2A4YKW0_UNCAE|nr:MAG: alpha/beta hydrolase [Candidatus Aerophobetes bacterium]
MKRVVKKIILTSALLVCGCLGFMFVKIYNNQDAILFMAVPLSQDYKFSSKHEFEEIYLDGKDGGKIHALHYKTKEKPKGLVLYYHGRGSNLAGYWSEFTDDFIERGYDLLIMDYRSFGKSRGKLTQSYLLSDAINVYKYAAEQYKPADIILYGRSLGTSIATYVASKHKVKMLILEAPYTSISDLAPGQFPFLPKSLVSSLVKYPLKTYEWIQSVKTPIHIFHGTKDKLIPYSNSVKLHSLAKNRTEVELTTIDEGTHNTLMHHNEYQNKLDFLLK